MQPRFQAVNGKRKVKNAVALWQGAFLSLGRTDHGFDKSLIWVDDLGIWLSEKGWKRQSGYRYWNGLGTTLGGQSRRSLVVEVNPPATGQPAGRFQGVVATDGAGDTWLLHRGEINAGSKRTNLKEHQDIAAELGFDIVSVEYDDGNVQECFVVANLNEKNTAIAASTKRFVNLCVAVRSFINGGQEEADVLKAASLFEEAQGSYFRGAQDEKEIRRIHAQVWKSLKEALTAKGLKVANEKVGTLGPDLFTVGQGKQHLFEIKITNGASDVMKAVGQLFVYEKALGQAYRKVMVLPEIIPDLYRELVYGLGIEVVEYRKAGTGHIFKWPKDL